MNRSTPELMTRWLAAEEDLDDEAAELALADLAAELPDLGPPPGFAARVMVQARAAERPELVWAERLGRVGVLFGVALSGIAALWLLPMAWALAPTPSAPAGVRLAAELFRRFGDALVALAGFADLLGALRKALSAPFDHPTVLVSLAILVSVAGGAFILLQNLIRRERSWSYVDL